MRATADYKVSADSIGGTIKTWGSLAAGQPDGAKVFTGVCIAAPHKEVFPQFIYNPANYTPAPVSFANSSAFNTYINAHKNDMKGTFVVGGSASDPNNYVDITGIKVSADLTIIANGPITADQGSADVTAANNDDKLMVLVSYYTPQPNVACASNGGNPGDCAIGIKNNFDPSDNTATLVYAPNGPVAFKNNAEFLGAVYAGNIVMKNNQVTTYDPRVEQIVGFGPVTLEQESWEELQQLKRARHTARAPIFSTRVQTGRSTGRDAFRAPIGTRDVLAPESDRWQALVACFAQRAGRAGFGLLVTPIFEHIEVVQKLGSTHRCRAQGAVRLRRQGRSGARAARRRHRVRRTGVRAEPAGAPVEGVVRRTELPLRAAAEGPVPPALAGRRRSARSRRSRHRRRGDRAGRRLLPRARVAAVPAERQLDG